MHKSLPAKFSNSMKSFRDASDKMLLLPGFLEIVDKHHSVFDGAIINLRDFDHTYDMIRDMQARSLMRTGTAVLERVQHMYMRTAIAIHLHDIPNVLATYEFLSSRQIIHDPMTYRNAGMIGKTLTATCAVNFSGASVQEMYDIIAKCVFTIRNGGRVGIAAQDVPCTGSRGTCNHTDRNIGLWPMMRLIEGAISFARQPDDKRTDIGNVCIEAWHVETRSLLEWLTIHRNELTDEKSLTVTLSIPDILMVRIEEDGMWSLFCPVDVPDLVQLRGHTFEETYNHYERSSIPRVRIRARDLWDIILRTEVLTGGPSIIYRDNLNGESKNLGTNSDVDDILGKSNLPDFGGAYHSDLRTGVIDMTGVNNHLAGRHHASISLPLMVTPAATFSFTKLRQTTRALVFDLNHLMDSSTPRIEDSTDPNKDYRCIAIGMHGLTDVFAALRMPYNSPEAATLNAQIAENMYYAALDASCGLAEKQGVYPAFRQSPLSKEIFHFDMWNATPSTSLDWEVLRGRVQKFGVRNAAIIAIAPGSCPESYTGYTDSIDPPASNVLDGQVVCPWLVRELVGLGIWSDDLREKIVNARGSVQDIENIPTDIKELYRTAWEISPDIIIQMALQRAPFVCHSEALSLYINSPTSDFMGEFLMRAWAAGMKTGLHKLYTRYPEQSSGSRTSSYEGDTDREMSFDDIVLSGNS
ncbi:ribonucleotide reductase [Mycena galericulata]|nr:ribonucleotide reductase [Mycena galericulata]